MSAPASVIQSGPHIERIQPHVWTLSRVRIQPWQGTSLMHIIIECQLADFVTGELTENIPFVFLPLSDQGLPQVRGPNSHEVILSICPSLAGAAWRIICLRIYSLNILLDISPNLTLSFINNANFLYFQRLASHPSLRQ